MSDLCLRTNDACYQLQRYAGAVATEELADVLDSLVELNDDMWHGRAKALIVERINTMKAQLDAIVLEYKE